MGGHVCCKMIRKNLLYPFDRESSNVDVMFQTLKTVFHHNRNTEDRIENTTRSGVFLTSLEVFGDVRGQPFFIYFLNGNQS